MDDIEQAAPDDALSGQAMPDIGQHQKLLKWIRSPNIAAELDATTLAKIGEKVRSEEHTSELQSH